MIKCKQLAAAALALSVMAAPALAAAAEGGAPPSAPSPPRAAAPSVESDAALGDLDGRGGVTAHQSIAITDQDLTAVNSGNTVQGLNIGSGAISLSENALSNFSGIGNFVVNTGHNNNLQGSISVTIIVTP